MNLQGLDQVRNADFYLDCALRKIKHAKLGTVPKDKDKKKTLMEKEKIKMIREDLKKSMTRIIKSFPDFDNLPEFYDALITTSLDKDRLRKSLATLGWGVQKVEELSLQTLLSMSRTDEQGLHKFKKAYIGRVSSIMKRLNPHLDFLEASRRVLLSFPSIKTDTYTICIAGFPNVGKSTLLAKLTGANPEINSYAFTTKSLNVGYFSERFEKVQVIDSPGTLARFEKMNDIEKQAYLAIKYVADIVVFVFDLTEPYPVKDQIRLYEELKETEKPIIVYFSKRDIMPENKVEEFLKSHPFEEVVLDKDELRSKVQKHLRHRFK